MRKIAIYFFCLLLPVFTLAQTGVDSLRRNLALATTDLNRYMAHRAIYFYYEEANRDSALKYATSAYQLALKNNKKLAQILTLNNIGYQQMGMGRYAASLKTLIDAFNLAEDKKTEDTTDWPLFDPPTSDGKKLMLCYTHHIYGILMWQTKNPAQEIFHFSEALRLATEIHFAKRMMMAAMNLGRAYLSVKSLDSAQQYLESSEKFAVESNFYKYLGNVYTYLGMIKYTRRDPLAAIEYFYKAKAVAINERNYASLSNNIYYNITLYYLSEKQKDSSLYYALNNLELFQSLGSTTGAVVNLGSLYNNVYLAYDLQNKKDSAYKYMALAIKAKDSLYTERINNLADFLQLNFDQQMKVKSLEKDRESYRYKVRIWFLLGGIAVLLLLAMVFYRNNRQKQQATLRITKAYADLKSAQSQLVHSEKMASLGELTAGIAHEIQNPLNFVNNFSEVNHELLNEMKLAIGKKNYQEVDELVADVISNEEKISFHGKRADSIVKSMLQHSRSSSGQKEPTDINALVDECLRLSFHGMRAKDKSFNVKMDTSFKSDLPKANIAGQDIGRVLLNLFTNAFYSMAQKKNEGQEGYDPMITVKTEKQNNNIVISVHDNGKGIPQLVIDKIFQPFFTTKPTGEGTGLGLSMSFDIISKGHGGQLKVESEEGQYAAFTIILPQ